MAWCSKWIDGDEFPDGVEVTVKRDGNVRRYLPERTCHVEYVHHDDITDDITTDLSCGHWVDGLPQYINYCPTCGSKVVSEWR